MIFSELWLWLFDAVLGPLGLIENFLVFVDYAHFFWILVVIVVQALWVLIQGSSLRILLGCWLWKPLWLRGPLGGWVSYFINLVEIAATTWVQSRLLAFIWHILRTRRISVAMLLTAYQSNLLLDTLQEWHVHLVLAEPLFGGFPVLHYLVEHGEDVLLARLLLTV